MKKGFSAYRERKTMEEEVKMVAASHFVVLFAFAFLMGLLFFAVTESDRIAVVTPEAPVIKTALEREIEVMVEGYPIEVMAQEIGRKDRRVAAYMIGIAKKESNWGKRSPKLDGKDCYNYWGFREQRERMGTGGHTCFENPHDAVRTVSKRIERLVYEYDRETAREMIVWKCGYSCATHSPESVEKWISDVAYYYQKLEKSKTEQF